MTVKSGDENAFREVLPEELEKELVGTGLLFAINSLVLHPVGLELVVGPDQDRLQLKLKLRSYRGQPVCFSKQEKKEGGMSLYKMLEIFAALKINPTNKKLLGELVEGSVGIHPAYALLKEGQLLEVLPGAPHHAGRRGKFQFLGGPDRDYVVMCDLQDEHMLFVVAPNDVGIVFGG